VSARDLLVGAVFAGMLAVGAWRMRALSASGAVAAFAVGALTYASGTGPFTLVLLAFFLPSVGLSRLGKRRKRELVDIGKGGARDAFQVLANGGIATACAVLFAFSHDPRWAWAFAGAYAAATADTWATEIGTLARHAPRSIFTLRPIPTGLSGGITLPGTLAEVAGALWIGAVALACVTIPLAEPRFPVLGVALAGVVGSTADSLLGATVQELRRCDACGRNCETDPHVCGAPTRLVRGLPGASNDVVNLLATVAGAAVAFALT
jgi:uncharacterized protein (TIGR00297 family)